MNKTVVWTVAIIVVGLVLVFYSYSQNTRYYIQSTGSSVGVAYKIDRKTGRTWRIFGTQEDLVGGSESKTSDYPHYLKYEQKTSWDWVIQYSLPVILITGFLMLLFKGPVKFPVIRLPKLPGFPGLPMWSLWFILIIVFIFSFIIFSMIVSVFFHI